MGFLSEENSEIRCLERVTNHIRQVVLDMVYNAKSGHIGGDFSEMELLIALYFKFLRFSSSDTDAPDRDRFVLSKGHCVEPLYAILAEKGCFPERELAGYGSTGSPFIGHPNRKIPGIEMNTGSLGHGLSLGCGMALAARMDHRPYHTYVLLGDGELNEGSVWEAAMFAAHNRLDKLMAIVDCNGLQISGPTEKVLSPGNLPIRWKAIGWHVVELADGNDMRAVCGVYEKALAGSGKPTVILAHTVKGAGCPSIEGKVEWHHRVPSQPEYERMKAELEEGALLL